MTAAARLSWARLIGYGVGDVANNLVFVMGTFFLLTYYTEVAGLPLVAVGTLLTAVKIYSACADLAVGRIVDGHSNRWGKFRPFILAGALPLFMLNIAVFSVPGSWSVGHKLIFAYLSYALLSTAYAFVNIPYGALASAMTQAPTERARLGSVRTVMAVLTGSVLTIVVGPTLVSLRGEALQHSLLWLTVTEAVLGTLLLGWCFAATRETVSRTVRNPDWRTSLRAIWHNRPLGILCACSACALAGYTCANGSLVFFARYLIDDPKQFFLVMGIQGLVTSALAFVVVPMLVDRWGKKGSMLTGLGLSLAGYVLVYVVAGVTATAITYAAFFVTSFGLRVAMATFWAMEADTVEYGEWRTGVRVEGITYAVFSLSRKGGQAIGVGLPAWLLAAAGFTPAAFTQSAAAMGAIASAVALVPALAILIAFVLMYFYPLTENALASIIRDTQAAQRRSA
ncbi:MAG: glycoside-pentoside-hexuronide (GPH):cation symporter [Rhodocyclaceae bacterium]